MHDAAYFWVAKTIGDLPPRRRVVEIGSRKVCGTIRNLFCEAGSYIGVDLREGELVDVVADAQYWRPEALVDTVVCTSVLEHTPEGRALVRAAKAMLEPGGVLILTAATEPTDPHSAEDGGSIPEHPLDHEYYGNICPSKLAEWIWQSGFSSFTLEHKPPDVFALAVK